MASQFKTKTHEGDSPTPDITQLFFLDLAQTDGKPPESAHTCGRFSYSTPRKQQSTEEASTPNIGRGAETQPKTTMNSLTTTIRTLPSIADYKHRVFGEPNDICTDCGASSQDVTPVRLHHTPDWLVTRGSMAESGEINSCV